MYRVCIALVDATRARLFTFDRLADEAGLDEQLVEHAEPLHGALDEHRGHRAGPQDASFARVALAALREVIDHDAPQRVLLCAGPRMLGTLRESCAGILPDGLPIEELARDFIAMSSSELRGELVARGLLLPPRSRSIA